MFSLLRTNAKAFCWRANIATNKFLIPSHLQFTTNFPILSASNSSDVHALEDTSSLFEENNEVNKSKKVVDEKYLPKLFPPNYPSSDVNVKKTYATGRRKTSSARVWICEGNGEFMVNYQQGVNYFQPIQREHALGPLFSTKVAGLYDVFCTVKGGGMSGQAGAVRLGIARALDNLDVGFRKLLRPERFLTRDRRRVERKKTGQHKARKKYQWVKR